MLIRRAYVWGRGPADVRIAGGRIGDCAPGLPSVPGEDELDARGGWLLPGLHDHHIHLRALAVAADSLQTGPPEVRTREELAAALRRVDRELQPGRWIRGIGYHQSVAGDLDRDALDRMVPHRPVRVQHRSGALWALNSPAVELVGLDDCELSGVERNDDGSPSGRIWRLDAWLAERIGTAELDLAAVSSMAARRGITGFTDATPGLSDHELSALADAVRTGAIRQRVHCMAPPLASDPLVPLFTLGPTKLLLDDDALPALDEFTALVRSAHAAGRPVAVHCVTRTQLVLAQVAFDEAGIRPGDRIEHGALVPADSLPWLRERGVAVVTQPHFAVERGAQYADEVPADEMPDLWRLRSLRAAGVRIAAGTDAPFGSADPWSVVRAAAAPRGLPQGPESIPAFEAVRLFLGRSRAPDVPRSIGPGEAADLTLLRPPPAEALGELAAGLGSDLVAATLVAGEPIFLAG
ncbi:amidohydrolase family protein [Actinospica sp.]|uniref:amidohydrolase family protein n=1 Tax=Actinospica sp. TaxID=1872142 RepID=UPI002C02DB8A|nr:amidohydrolase family protein [Actinospica sp.]HWG26711.1 amidohydrolase family protein [Actinospica sp.]